MRLGQLMWSSEIQLREREVIDSGTVLSGVSFNVSKLRPLWIGSISSLVNITINVNVAQ